MNTMDVLIASALPEHASALTGITVAVDMSR